MRAQAAVGGGLARLLGLLALAGFAAAEPSLKPAFDAGIALRTSQAAIGRELSDAQLTDQDGRPISLQQLRGRPLVISPIYTSCYYVCPITTTHLRDVAVVARGVLGADSFTILTLGFDTAHDTPERMREFARERGIDTRNWAFASADASTARRLLEQIGFTYVSDGAGFEHLVQATVVDPQGRVYRQIYGQEFETPLLVDALKRLIAGQRAGEKSLPALLETVRLICSAYDPASGRYRFDYSLILSILIGALCMASIGLFLWHSWRELPRSDRAP